MAQRYRERGKHIQALERELHALKASRRAAAPAPKDKRSNLRPIRPKEQVTLRDNPSRSSVSPADLKALTHAFARSPAYNKTFAGGHQLSGVVPIPQQSADKQPRSFLAADATCSITVPVGSSSVTAILCNPYAQNPFIAIEAPTTWKFLWPTIANGRYQDYPDWGIANNTVTGVQQVVESTWTGVGDPRTRVSGYNGPYDDDLVEEDASGAGVPGDICSQQFMGGRLELTSSVPWQSTGRIAVLDSKSYPTFYGTKIAPFSTVGFMNGSTSALLNKPDEEDSFQWFEPQNNGSSGSGFFGQQLTSFFGIAQPKVMQGATETATQEIAFNIVPEGTRWCPWEGNYNTSTGFNNASIGGVPARNLAAYIAAGYPIIFIANDSTTELATFTLTAYLAYNVHIPTSGLNAQTALAEMAPVTPPHSATVDNMRSIPMIHTDKDKAAETHRQASVIASSKAGLENAHLYIRKPAPIHPQVARKATSALEPLPDLKLHELVGAHADADPMAILKSIKDFDPEKVLSSLHIEDIADSVKPLEELGALF